MTHAQPEGHLALPASGKGRPVLVLHPWWGLNATMKAVCGRLANAGFVAFAPDLYHGKIATTIPEAEALAGSIFNGDASKSEVREAAAFVRERGDPAQRDLAVMGFSLGAFYALDLSVADPELVQSVVLFYGTRPGDYSRARADFLGHFAENDEFEPQSEVDGLAEALKSAGRPATFHHYAGTKHWFFEPDRPEYDQAATPLAWDRTLIFLGKGL